MRILLVEDDEALGEGITEGLALDGHKVDWLTDGNSALNAFDADTFDAAILDLSLPGDGTDVLTIWRAAGHATPVLVLTAMNAQDQCVALLDNGADDYVVKPSNLEEIQARLRALIRRGQGRVDNRLVCGDLVLDTGTHSVSVNDEPVSCSAFELIVLQTLAERAQRPVSRDQISSTLYGWGDGPESNSIEVVIHNLRAKIGAQRIETVRGLGYQLVP